MKVSPDNCFHLPIDTVLEIHREAITQFGGSEGLRDLALLESAIAAPQAGFGGKSHYTDLPDIAAAYLFFLCKNHPFIDGNKRTALGACLVFLRLNGLNPIPDNPSWEELTMAIASNQMSRHEAAEILRKLIVH